MPVKTAEKQYFQKFAIQMNEDKWMHLVPYMEDFLSRIEKGHTSGLHAIEHLWMGAIQNEQLVSIHWNISCLFRNWDSVWNYHVGVVLLE